MGLNHGSFMFFFNVYFKFVNDFVDTGSIEYRSKVWTHFFSFFKTAVEIGPVG